MSARNLGSRLRPRRRRRPECRTSHKSHRLQENTGLSPAYGPLTITCWVKPVPILGDTPDGILALMGLVVYGTPRVILILGE